MKTFDWKNKPIIAMVHVFDGERQKQIDQAIEDAKRLQDGGVDGLLIENYGCGYLDTNRATDEMGKRLTEITIAVKKCSKIPVGINVLPNDYWKSFSLVSYACGMFIQMDHITGNFYGHESVEETKYIKIRNRFPTITVFGGIHPKYYELTEPNCSLAECAKKAMLLADAVVVTGEITGGEATLKDLHLVRKTIGKRPLIVGSGLNVHNVKRQLSIADGAIVGTAFKKNGVLHGEQVDVNLVKKFMEEVVKLR